MTTIYYRFGQSVLQDCEYCHTYDEYALYAIPRPLLSYIRETAVAGLLTISGTHKERWRMYAIGTIVCAAVTEGYWVSTVQVKIPRDGLGVVMVCNFTSFLQIFLLIFFSGMIPYGHTVTSYSSSFQSYCDYSPHTHHPPTHP